MMKKRLSVIILTISVLQTVAVIIRDYNKVNFLEFDSFQDFAKTYLTFNHGMGTNTNVLLGVSEPSCKDVLETPAFRGAQRHAGGDVMAIALIPAKGFPLKLEACAEAFFYKVNTTISNPTARTTNLEHRDLTSWTSDHMYTSFRLRNGFDFNIVFYWHEESHEPNRQGILEAGTSTKISSFLGHIFAARRQYYTEDGEEDNSEDGELLDYMVVSGQDYTFSPINRLETCEVVAGTGQFVEGEINCADMEMRLVEFTHNVWYEKRLGLNYVQPQFVRPVTSEGFMNIRLPAETYGWLKAWYEREQLADEGGEGPVGPCMNQHVAPSSITHLTSQNKDRLSRELRPILENWYGGNLVLTSIYGIRKYTNGSVLRMHVDTVNTHVVSAIINVDQAVDVDWPLIILDHNDNEHHVIMQPGDMLLYESAKLLHGRPTPFVGAHYDNIFIHYKPDHGWDYGWV